MPASSAAAQEKPRVVCHSFNQLHTHLAVGTTVGWHIVACEPYTPCQEARSPGGVAAIQMLFTSSLIAIVGNGERAEDSPRRLRLWNSSTSSPVFELTFATEVLRVLMNRTRLLVVLSDATHVFELSTMRLLHLLESAPNPKGIGALCSSDAAICAVWPGGHAPGWAGRLTIFDASQEGSAVASVAAHHSNICCVALNARGELMATASDKGTVIRVHRVPSGECMHTFRRGSMRATVYSLAFAAVDQQDAEAEPPAGVGGEAADGAPADASMLDGAGRPRQASSSSGSRHAAKRNGPLLCATSSTGTVHVWRCGQLPGSAADGAAADQLGHLVARCGGAAATPRGGLASLQKWLGAQTASASAERDFAHVRLRLPKDDSWCVAAMREESGAPSDLVTDMAEGGDVPRCALYVLTARGEFFVHALDARRGGTCVLQDERRIWTSDD